MTKGDDLVTPYAWKMGADGSTPVINENTGALTKREYFAAMILQGLVSKYTMNTPDDQFTISKMSCELADEFIKHLNA